MTVAGGLPPGLLFSPDPHIDQLSLQSAKKKTKNKWLVDWFTASHVQYSTVHLEFLLHISMHSMLFFDIYMRPSNAAEIQCAREVIRSLF